ncbi:hypothetical protein ACQ4PT_003395 [Festuca glaucescens]
MASFTIAAAAALLFCLLAADGCCAKNSNKTHHAPPSPGTSPPAPVSSANATDADTGRWLDARATWYGAPTGAGPDDNGGACGFKNVNLPPFSAMTSCGNEPLFKDGKGCGSCYQIRCVAQNHPACSGVPKTVIITDMNYFPVSRYHFDLSAAPPSSLDRTHTEYLAILVEYEDGDGDVVQVDIMDSRLDTANEDGMTSTGEWVPMKESWGSIWRVDTRRPMQGPFSLRITNESGKTLVADWEPNAIYRSIVQFN